MSLKKLWYIAPLLAACVSPPVEAPQPTVEQATNVATAQTVKNKVDILFMVDNSPSMDAMQAELISKFHTFLGVFDALAHPTDGSTPQYADLQIGVVTSDYGAGAVDGSSGSHCFRSPGGQRGLLQAKGDAAASTCGVPTDAAFIKYAFAAGGDECNLPGGCTPDALGAQFTCMASVGSSGCGFEHQLESVYAALTSTDPTNAGFVRPDALLAVVFVTNEDDGSASPQVDFYDPDPSKDAQYGAYATYRQTRFGVSCDGMPAPEGPSNGPFTTCGPTPAMMDASLTEYDVSRYVDLFNTPGVVKGDPTNDIILVAIDPPVTPFSTILATVNTGVGKAPSPSYVPCDAIGPSCVVALQHSCQNTAQPAFFGDPPVRLEAVLQSQHLHESANICGQDPTQPPDYSTALQQVASLISSSLKPGCVPAPLPDPANPDCTVEDVTTHSDGSVEQHSIESCATTMGALPCWTAVMDPRCAPPASPQSISIQIDRPSGYSAPPDTTARVECSTKACPASNPDC